MNLESLTKSELHALCDRLLPHDIEAIDECIVFFEADTRGLWHGRARAMMARRLKHCPLTELQRARLSRVILVRFVSGQFSEQFKDQLRLAMQLAPEPAYDLARRCLNSKADHIRRYAAWILSRETNHR